MYFFIYFSLKFHFRLRKGAVGMEKSIPTLGKSSYLYIVYLCVREAEEGPGIGYYV
jgi:hypothetical protein